MVAADTEQYLFARARRHLCALALSSVSEIMRPLPLERVARAPSVVLGLSLIRGRPTIVLDAGRLLGETEDSRLGRYLLLRVEQRAVALAVEEVLGIGALPEPRHDLPPLLASAQADVVSEIGALDFELLLVLKHGRVLSSYAGEAS